MWGTNACNKFLTLLEKKPFWTILELFCKKNNSHVTNKWPRRIAPFLKSIDAWNPQRVSTVTGVRAQWEGSNIQEDVWVRWRPVGSEKRDARLDGWCCNTVNRTGAGQAKCYWCGTAQDRSHEKRGAIKLTQNIYWKIWYEATAVPTGKTFMTPIKKILQVKPRIVRWVDLPAAK